MVERQGNAWGRGRSLGFHGQGSHHACPKPEASRIGQPEDCGSNPYLGIKYFFYFFIVSFLVTSPVQFKLIFLRLQGFEQPYTDRCLIMV